MTATLRPMRAADLDQVLAIVTASPEAPQWQPSGYASYFHRDPTNPKLLRTALVATSHPEILAFAAATLLLDGAQNVCHLDSMAVLPHARRQGLGFNLLRALLAWASRSGARHFSLEVRASNDPAIALYSRLGLHLEGRRPRYYTHPEEDALLLGRSLPPIHPTPVFHDEIY